MLQFSRSQPSDRWVEDLNVVIRRASEAVLAYRSDREDSVRFEASAVACPVHMSPIEMEQAIVNVLRNAVESSERGVRVGVRTRLEGDVVRVEVEDDGRGMALEQLEHAFDPFYTSRLQDGGAGLGLSVAHGLISSHGGDIRMDSKEGDGTLVTITLPLHARESS
jgi:signal transduction histidine kinase